jgi:tRNA G18 (ribose-2'-O)-methylase SpoU
MRKLSNQELNRCSIDEFKAKNKIPLIVVIDNVRSMNNIGSVFRSCDAFSVEALFLCGISSTPPHRDIHKTALGAELSVNWKYFENTIDAINELKKNDYIIVAIEQTDESTMLDKFLIDNTKKYAIIFGNEVNGIDDNIIRYVNNSIEIPQTGTKHSINIAVSAGIVIWEFYKSLKICIS